MDEDDPGENGGDSNERSQGINERERSLPFLFPNLRCKHRFSDADQMSVDLLQDANCQRQSLSSVLSRYRRRDIALDRSQKCNYLRPQRIDVTDLKAIDRNTEQRVCSVRI